MQRLLQTAEEKSRYFAALIAMNTLTEILRSGKATIIDVRTPAEFIRANAAGSVNIPLQDIPRRIKDLERMENIVLCCASGMRSQEATAILRRHGISAINGGSWMDITLTNS
jgi:phage shock protein E